MFYRRTAQIHSWILLHVTTAPKCLSETLPVLSPQGPALPPTPPTRDLSEVHVLNPETVRKNPACWKIQA